MADFFTPNPVDPDFPPVPRFPELPKRVDWRPEDLELNRLWWKRPQKVRILMYMDGASFDGGSFHGLQHVIGAVTSDPWPWAQFVVTTANRYSDLAADQDNVTLTDLNLDTFDEVWLFGISSDVGLLSAAEVTTLEAFMDGGGGVLTTGDHASLGRGLSGAVKRVKDLRMYPAPAAAHPVWNTTIRDANADGDFAFGEQSDSTPQVIRPRYTNHYSLGGGFVQLKRSPHPLLCAEHGVLKKLPDHQHEGQVTIPTTFPVSDWPKAGSYQAQPQVVAWGRIIDPSADNAGTEFPVIGAYDGHGVATGRIVADSTWHHWFDINLTGFNPAGTDYRDITSYYQNVAAWLAPAAKQAGMRNGVFWLALHENIIFEHRLAELPLRTLVPIVRDALGRWAPQCLVRAWLFEHLPIAVRTAVVGEAGPPRSELPLEDVVIAEAMADLQDRFDIRSGVLRAADKLEVIDEAIAAAVPRAAKRLLADCEASLESAQAIAGKLGAVSPGKAGRSKNGAAKTRGAKRAGIRTSRETADVS